MNDLTLRLNLIIMGENHNSDIGYHLNRPRVNLRSYPFLLCRCSITSNIKQDVIYIFNVGS